MLVQIEGSAWLFWEGPGNVFYKLMCEGKKYKVTAEDFSSLIKPFKGKKRNKLALVFPVSNICAGIYGCSRYQLRKSKDFGEGSLTQCFACGVEWWGSQFSNYATQKKMYSHLRSEPIAPRIGNEMLRQWILIDSCSMDFKTSISSSRFTRANNF